MPKSLQLAQDCSIARFYHFLDKHTLKNETDEAKALHLAAVNLQQSGDPVLLDYLFRYFYINICS